MPFPYQKKGFDSMRNKVVAQAKAWIGYNEADGSHKKIIDIYNAHTPLARGYKVKYTDAWCATFVSAVAIQAGVTAILPTECGCGQMMNLFREKGCWVEADNYKPAPGDVIFYDWEDSGNGDNVGWPDHVGIVEKVTDKQITVIEGNYSNSVKRRYINIDAKLIRGYGVPKYDKEQEDKEPIGEAEAEKFVTVLLPQLAKGDKGASVKALQILLIGYGYSCGKSGVDGDFGAATDKAVKAFQAANGLEADGIVGKKTWAKLLG